MHLGSSGVLTPLKKFVKYANTCAQGDTLGGVGTFTKEVVFAGLRWVWVPLSLPPRWVCRVEMGLLLLL